MRIIPAIDLINGQCVRLSQGDYNKQTTYSNSPLDVAKRFQDHGITHLHLVDLDGAKQAKLVNYKVLEAICSKTNLHVDFGGGIKTNQDLHIAFESGAKQVTGGSIAVNNWPLFLEWLFTHGSDKIILGADAKNRKVATGGWLDESDEDVVQFIEDYESKGVEYVICTDIAKDGMLQGPSIELYKEILDQSPQVKLIASGGVAELDDLFQLKTIGCEGAIVGKAIYEGTIDLKELEKQMSNGCI